MFRGKKYKEIAKQIDKAALYDPKEGLELICKTASAKFDETVELHVKLGCFPGRSGCHVLSSGILVRF